MLLDMPNRSLKVSTFSSSFCFAGGSDFAKSTDLSILGFYYDIEVADTSGLRLVAFFIGAKNYVRVFFSIFSAIFTSLWLAIAPFCS